MDILEQLTRDEDEILHAYPDSQGYWTIGIGRLIDKRKGGGISHDEALYLLKNDIDKATEQLAENLPWTASLDDARHGALVNMSFNMGIHGLMGFKNTLAMIQAGDYANAAANMLQSKWAEQVGPRAHRLAKQMETGEWQ
jgi:lysozyme